jgi:hypothetical protein
MKAQKENTTKKGAGSRRTFRIFYKSIYEAGSNT